MSDVTDPVCGMTFPEETAEELGAFKIVRAGKTHWLCSSTCRDAFEKHPERYDV
jgi:YHS domain-containing protein